MELSFIDWDSLDEDEFVKLNHIINYPYDRPSVQLPFQQEKELTDPTRTQQVHHVSQTAGFQPGVQPQNMANYPVQMHMAPGNPGLAGPHSGQYPYTVQGGYIFQNPSQSGGCEASVSYVNGMPMYGFPGINMTHSIPPHFQGPPPQLNGDFVTIPMTVACNGSIIPPLHHVQSLPTVPQYVTQLEPGSFPLQIDDHTAQCHQIGGSSPQPTVYIQGENADINDKTCSEPNEEFKQSPVDLKEIENKPTFTAMEFGGPIIFTPQDNDYENKDTPINPAQNVITNFEDDNDACKVAEKLSMNTSTNKNPIHKVSTFSKQIDVDNITMESVNLNINGVNDIEADTVNQNSEIIQPHQQGVKSWSSLFSGSKKRQITSTGNELAQPVPNPYVDASSFPTIGSVPSAETSREWRPATVKHQKIQTVNVQDDPLASRLTDQLNNLQIVHAPVVIQPRGLKNGSNTCFLNAPLQVLMGCPPFVHMFRSFKHVPSRHGTLSSTPILDSLVQFVNSFQNGQRIKYQGLRPKKLSPSDLNIGSAFVPELVINVAQDILGLEIGVQHDAEEFLSQILSICNEEMEKLIKMNEKVPDAVEASVESSSNKKDHMLMTSELEKEEDEDEAWQQVGPKNHHVETNVNDCGQTPISSIFAGLSRSCLVRETGKSSDTVDSFFSLKLDIQGDTVHSVKDALLRLNTMEVVHDADGRKVHGQRRMFFDTLPHVLIMHLKLFKYSHGDGHKIQKKISFDVDLQVPKEIISKVGKPKYSSSKSRNYKLFGVVNHHGRKINDGHYTSDVFLPITSGWLRFDDVNIHIIQEADVLNYSERSMPYILFYRRMEQT